VCLPGRKFPLVRGIRLFNRYMYAGTVFTSMFYHREMLWTLFGPPFLRLAPVGAIIVYVYLVLNRIAVGPLRTKPHQL
jgi:hypothetical protein